MKTLRYLLATSLLTIAAAGLAGVTSAAGAASIAPAPAPTGQPAGDGIGYNNVIGSEPVYSDVMRIGAATVYDYCLVKADVYVSSGTYSATTTASLSSIPNLAKALDIAANSSSLGTPLSVAAAEAVAIQLAIWYETSGFDYHVVPNSYIDNRVSALVSAATNLAPTRFGAALRPVVTRVGSTETVTLHLVDSAGHPYAGQSVTVTAPGYHGTLTSSAAGTIVVRGLRRAGTLAATWNAVLPAGTIMVTHQTGSQPLVTAGPVVTPVSVHVAIRPSRPVTTTTRPRTPTTTPAPPVTTPAPPVTTPVTVPVRHRHHPTATTTTPTAPPVTAPTTLPTTPVTVPPAPGSGHNGTTTWIILILALIALIVVLWRYFASSRR